uniref:Uncharacterized protein n=1 Tax=Rhizophora mucronata TaxID=61149 RepID=A0A2P2QYU5_RHIMU
MENMTSMTKINRGISKFGRACWQDWLQTTNTWTTAALPHHHLNGTVALMFLPILSHQIRINVITSLRTRA